MVEIYLFLALALAQEPTAEHHKVLQAVDVQAPEGVKTDGDSPHLCRVSLVVGRDGFPDSAKAEGCESDYGQASVAALLQWQFEPHLVDGVAVEVTTAFPVVFHPNGAVEVPGFVEPEPPEGAPAPVTQPAEPSPVSIASHSGKQDPWQPPCRMRRPIAWQKGWACPVA